jgi:hypothetical protein
VDDFLAAPIAETRLFVDGIPVEDLVHEPREYRFPFTPNDDVHPGKLAVKRGSHGPFAVRAAEHACRIGQAGLHELRKRQGRNVLTERRREPYKTRLCTDELIGALCKKA